MNQVHTLTLQTVLATNALLEPTVLMKEQWNVQSVQQGSTVQLKELQYVKHVQQGSSLQKAVTHALIVQEGLIVPQGLLSAFPADLESTGKW